MEITQEELDRLSFQERTVLFLTNAAYNVLQYARAEYVQAKVDVAFAAEDGLTVYSYDQGHEVIRYLVRPDGTPVPTIRLENFRDGLEDYAYAKLLEARLAARPEKDDDWGRRAKELLAVPRDVMDTMTNYTDDPAALYAWRDAMADLIEK